LNFALKKAGIDNINEVDYVSYSWENTPEDVNAIFGINGTQNKRIKFAKQLAKSILRIAPASSGLKLPVYYPNYKLTDKAKFTTNNHHLAHAASAYFTRKSNDKCLIFTLDGSGDNICTAIWMGEGNNIKLLKSYSREAAIGWAYSVVTEGLHWIHGDGEGKTMGLAPYGNASSCRNVLDKYFPVFEEDKLVKPSQLGKDYLWRESGSVQFHFDEAKEVEALILKYGREHIAAEAQRKLEEAVMNLVFWVGKENRDKKSCIFRWRYAKCKIKSTNLEQPWKSY
jgi:carbamoyltransferase